MADQQQIRAQLARILASNSFRHSERLRKFLSYVVMETIEGRGHMIKSYSIGIEALGRPDDFDVAHDGIVRTTANRLRSTLDKYYLVEGARDPVVISLPKGRYIPEFIDNSADMPIERTNVEPDPGGALPPDLAAKGVHFRIAHGRGRRILPYAAAALLLVTTIAFGALQIAQSNHPRAAWGPPVLLVRATAALTDDAHAILLARGLPVQLSGAMAFYDINSVVRTKDPGESQAYVAKLAADQSVYVVTSEVGSDSNRLFVYWQLVDARTSAVLWSSKILEPDDGDIDRFVDVMVQELVGEEAVIRSAERRNLPIEPIAGYVCVTHSFNKMIAMSEADRVWMSDCLTRTVTEQPSYAQAWALLALVRIEDSIAAADRGEEKIGRSMLDNGWASYLNAERLAPSSWLTLRAKILLEFQREDLVNFRHSVARAMNVLPGNARERISIGGRLFALGEYEQAEAVITETIASMTLPQPSDYMFLMASLYRRGEYEDAVRLMRDHPIPTSTFYWSLLAAVAGRLGDSEGAAAALQSLDQLQPGFSSVLEADLRNRLFRDDFIKQLTADFDSATAIPRRPND